MCVTVRNRYRNMRNSKYGRKFVGILWEFMAEHVRNMHIHICETYVTCDSLLLRYVTPFCPHFSVPFSSDFGTRVTMLRNVFRNRNETVALCSVFHKYQNGLIFTEHGTLSFRKLLRLLRTVAKVLRPVTKIPIFMHATCT